MDKTFRVYIVNDTCAEDARYYNEVEEFAGMDYKYEDFESENDAERFIDGLFYGIDERSPAGFCVLREWDSDDEPFIESLLSE